MTKLIISFSHSNYLKSSSGTERSIRETYKILWNENIHHLNIFPIRSLSIAHLNDKLIGVYTKKNLKNMIIELLLKYSYELNCIHLQHLMNHNLVSLKSLLVELDVPIVLFLHDFYTICKSPHFMTHENKFCGITKPTNFKCEHCKYGVGGIEHYSRMRDFLLDIFPLVETVIAPSSFVISSWINIFPVYEKKTVVRSHLLINFESKKLPIIKGKVRIAFVGSSQPLKGYEKWLELVNYLKEKSPQSYEFYNFGNNSDKVDGVQNVFVSIASQGENAMIQSLKKYSIHCALLWSLSPETYSYVYYELLTSGVFVLSNTMAGNVVSEVEKYNNGVIFSSFKECISLVSKPNELKSLINSFKGSESLKAIDFYPNSNTDSLFFFKETNKISTQPTKNYLDFSNKILTFLYILRFKLKKLLNLN